MEVAASGSSYQKLVVSSPFYNFSPNPISQDGYLVRPVVRFRAAEAFL